jgi:tetratricopeptide (TPR) repeat protein
MVRCRTPLAVFAVALGVRLVYLAEIRDRPTFDVPLVDGANYFRLAQAIAAGDLLGGTQAFWQPPLYPYLLALLIALFGPSMTAIYAVQAALGALSCLLVLFIGRRLFGERAAALAAIVMALYGPLVHFDLQPLVPVLHVPLVLGGLLLMLRAGGIAAPAAAPRRDGALAGLLWGLAAIATPNILLAVPAAAIWALGPRCRPAGAGATGTAAPEAAGPGALGTAPPARAPGRRDPGPAVLLLAGVALPVALVAARNLAVAGEPVLISSNGGINLFIGNNPDYERTLRIRPGGEFERLAQEPENLGIVSAAARSRHFAGRALRFVTGEPRAAARLYLRKARDLVAGREIPRNEDAYAYRRHSRLLSLLLWRFGIAFPFGVVAPLALAGAFAAPAPDAGRRGRRLLLLYAGAYALSILLFFPTDRYRLPLVPVLALFAGSLLAAPAAAWRRPAAAAALLFGLVLFNLDAPRPRESWPEEEALNLAYALRVKGRIEEARAEYRRALVQNPRRLDPHNALAALAAQEGRWEEAAAHYRVLVDLAPDFPEARRSLGQAYLALGRREEARREWRIAAGLAPGAGLALADLCLSYLDEGYPAAAEPWCERAVRARPDLPETHLAYGLTARALRQRDRARAALAEAARLFPSGSEGRRRAEEILERMRRKDERDAGTRSGEGSHPNRPRG